MGLDGMTEEHIFNDIGFEDMVTEEHRGMVI